VDRVCSLIANKSLRSTDSANLCKNCRIRKVWEEKCGLVLGIGKGMGGNGGFGPWVSTRIGSWDVELNLYTVCT
jgi:hypothetical protein